MTFDIRKSVRGSREAVVIHAFTFVRDPLFYAVDNGSLLEEFIGNCIVYGDDRVSGIFQTGFTEEGERYWQYLGETN